MKKSLVVHPFLFAIFHILFLFSHNVEQVSFSIILLPSAIVLSFTLVFVFLLKLVFQDSKKVAILISVAIILYRESCFL